MVGHRAVDVAGELDEPVAEVELARAPGEVVRVDRDAVPADARARPEGHEAERLGRRGVDDLPDVEAHPLAQQRELVDERDVHVAEDVLEQLGHLGRVGRGELVAPRRRARRAGGPPPASSSAGVIAADQARDGHVARVAVAGADPLGREGELEVGAGDQAGSLELLAERAGRRARPCRRLEHDQLAGAERGADRARPRRAPAARSGSLRRASIGVETQTKMASTSARPSSSGARTRARCRARAASRSSAMSSIGERPPRELADAVRVGVVAATRSPASTNAIARGRPT